MKSISGGGPCFTTTDIVISINAMSVGLFINHVDILAPQFIYTHIGPPVLMSN